MSVLHSGARFALYFAISGIMIAPRRCGLPMEKQSQGVKP